jgi:hypothetical protein
MTPYRGIVKIRHLPVDARGRGRRPGSHSLILCLMWTGVCALDIPVRALPVTVAGFALIAAGIALYVRGPSSFTSSP